MVAFDPCSTQIDKEPGDQRPMTPQTSNIRLSSSFFFVIVLLSLSFIFVNRAACSEQMFTNQFVEARGKFDRFLQSKTEQAELDLICEQYSSGLQRLLDSIPKDLTYLRKCVEDETLRTEEVRMGYLSDVDRFRRVKLDFFWPQNLTHKEAVSDFRTVLSVVPGDSPPTERPDIRGGFGEDAVLFGIPWLAHTDRFLEKFQDEIKSRSGSKTQILMPGFPRSSFFYYAFDGDFTKFAEVDVADQGAGTVSASSSPVRINEVGTFNRMHLVTDSYDQVVAVQFSCEAPSRAPVFRSDNEVGVFNYVLFRRKAIRTAAFYQTDEYTDFYKLTNILKTQEGRLLEINVFYLPKPCAELVKFVLMHP
jgi:hypothetical protein